MARKSKKAFTVKNFEDFKKLSKKKVFSKWDKQKGRYELNESLPTKELIKALRYVHSDFDNYDLRKFKDNPQTRAKVGRIFNEYFRLKNRAGVREFIPHKNNRKKVSRLTGQSTKWKKYYVPKGDITYKKTNSVDYAVEKTDVAKYVILYFADFWKNKEEFIDNPDAVVNRMINFVNKNIGNYLFFKFVVGAYDANFIDGQAYFDQPEDLIESFNKFVMRYNSTDTQGEAHYKEFLTGIKFVLSFNKKRK